MNEAEAKKEAGAKATEEAVRRAAEEKAAAVVARRRHAALEAPQCSLPAPLKAASIPMAASASHLASVPIGTKGRVSSFLADQWRQSFAQTSLEEVCAKLEQRLALQDGQLDGCQEQVEAIAPTSVSWAGRRLWLTGS